MKLRKNWLNKNQKDNLPQRKMEGVRRENLEVVHQEDVSIITWVVTVKGLQKTVGAFWKFLSLES